MHPCGWESEQCSGFWQQANQEFSCTAIWNPVWFCCGGGLVQGTRQKKFWKSNSGVPIHLSTEATFIPWHPLAREITAESVEMCTWAMASAWQSSLENVRSKIFDNRLTHRLNVSWWATTNTSWFNTLGLRIFSQPRWRRVVPSMKQTNIRPWPLVGYSAECGQAKNSESFSK
jgi:hypothetical protein